MSYCVNCGVKLDQSLQKCPLCNTPVINPNELKKAGYITPFPTEQGETEKVQSKDTMIIITVFLVTTALSCNLLNLLLFKSTLWSIPVVGLCAFVWVAVVPVIAFKQLPIYVFLLFDGLAMAGYLYMLTFLTSTNEWLIELGLPITALTTLFILIFTFLVRKVSASILAVTLYADIIVAIFCIGIELFIRHYKKEPLHIVWSAIVLVPCSIIGIILITILSRKRLREAVRRRLHF